MTAGKEISIVYEPTGVMHPQQFDIPKIGPKDMLLKVRAVGVCGSDAERYSLHLHHKPFPMILGHETVGTVAEIGEEASKVYRVSKGDYVVVEPYILCGHCRYCIRGYYQLCENMKCYGVNISCMEPPHLWGAYGEYLYVAPGSRVHRISEKVPKEVACLASIFGNAVRWVSTKGEVKPGDNVVIIGSGMQGLASTIVARHSGAGTIIVTGLTIDRKRLELARFFGADYTINIQQESAIERVKEITGGEMADIVICCASGAEAVKTGLNLVKPLGTYVIPAGWEVTPLDVTRIVMNELTIRGGLGQSLDVERAIKIMESGKYPIEKMITHRFPLEKAEEAVKCMARLPPYPPDEVIKAVIIPG